MKIGIAGCGMVGTALKHGFEHLGHEVYISDPKWNTTVKDIINTEAVFICVPTNQNEDGDCDISIVESVVRSLTAYRYNGIIVIKSTIPPNTTQSLAIKYERELAFVPEFLRERCATEDFINNQDLLIIGCTDIRTANKIKEIHGNLPKKTLYCSTSEAEAVKYFNNIYNATLITFANSFCTICDKLGIDYEIVKNIAVNRNHINNAYLRSDENIRGFGGYCLPKDTAAFNFLARMLAPDVLFFENLLTENKKYRITVFKGMRK